METGDEDWEAKYRSLLRRHAQLRNEYECLQQVVAEFNGERLYKALDDLNRIRMKHEQIEHEEKRNT